MREGSLPDGGNAALNCGYPGGSVEQLIYWGFVGSRGRARPVGARPNYYAKNAYAEKEKTA